uniref:Uncharacterized protein n=1 Tax=Nicotiana tabacum TaxID=4097 RepID=A0A1S3Y9Q3_TOBAC|nr:PREDICTED: uncharacterized protein LOC107773906 [Nicotiana tabacum]XP_016448819.1 PREDICTED: uncharacterized protein LOC107773906 [Nicotiana tabacum]XP_016448820.1 PREDICTED: uncharacterized protein LOC107773906 [Nicotiana tabacum]
MEKSKQPQINVTNNYLGRGLNLDVSAVKAIRDTYPDSPSGSSENVLPLSRPCFELLYETPERSANQRRLQMGSFREQRVEGEGLAIVSRVPSHSTSKSYNQVANPNMDELGISNHKPTRKLDDKKRAKVVKDDFQDIQFQLRFFHYFMICKTDYTHFTCPGCVYAYYLPKVEQDDDAITGASAKDHIEDFYIDVPQSQIVKYTNPEASAKDPM